MEDRQLVTGTDFITLSTKDLEAAQEFYGNVLGLPFGKRWGNMPGAEYETGHLTPDGNVLAIHHRYAPPDATPPAR